MGCTMLHLCLYEVSKFSVIKQGRIQAGTTYNREMAICQSPNFALTGDIGCPPLGALSVLPDYSGDPAIGPVLPLGGGETGEPFNFFLICSFTFKDQGMSIISTDPHVSGKCQQLGTQPKLPDSWFLEIAVFPL